ncbi:Crp/Fnr family transcriptional regulator [Limosilactobacillus sp. STM2_1]|uniref:Crp/Fnr family transcriptional regulator n=1 Tax=Limosilactobacillus rudii TaxID=2759755 RepID=A0A7W3UJ91_9LACO|nr:Crp/Fnr family transcriptional regulator [Limosilactobacillus rudii]MBB1078389.1 Crp/Fnr family transcriptional regulator [Limosilactobacillus rudii]MBB1096519.1 Crp/Fnr family transcriptional regulator [Limosilactobacillus rudii]MCD7134284.1 Crp/Fnr family transcriptional regulator [Limosilactobacillus rudii]
MAEELCVQLVPLFQKLDLEKQQQVEQLVHHQHTKMHELIITPDSQNQLVIIAHGSVKMYSLDSNGNEKVVRALSSGDFVGETWLLGINNQNYFIEAVEDSDICIINQADFLALLKNSPEITATLLKEQAERITSLRKQTQLLSIVNISTRITTYLSQLQQSQGKASIELPFALKDVASYLGTTPETLTRKLKLLEKQGKIEYHLRKIKIKDKL